MRVVPFLLLALACGGEPPTASAGPPASSKAAPKANSVDLPEVVGTIGGKPVTAAELTASGGAQLNEALSALYTARREAFDSMVIERLIADEASKRSMSEDELLKAEIDDKVPALSAEEVAAFYSENEAQMQGTLEQMDAPIRQHLRQQELMNRARSFFEELRAASKVENFLPRYRINVPPSDASPKRGNPDAPVRIVEYSDFQCGYCAQAIPTLAELEKRYGDKIVIEYRHFPLPMHQQAPRASEASQCANDQGKFWEYHDHLFANRRAWTDSDLKSFAGELGLEQETFDACLEAGTHAATVENDLETGAAVGMSGTPGFFVNGVMLSGAQPTSAFVEVIDEELKSLGG